MPRAWKEVLNRHYRSATLGALWLAVTALSSCAEAQAISPAGGIVSPPGIQPRSGPRLLRLRHHPVALALDAHARRLIVLSDDDTATLTAGSSDPAALPITALSVLNADTGTLLRTTTLRASVHVDPGTRAPALATDARCGSTFILLNGGSGRPATVMVLETATGRPLRRIAVGPEALALAVDARDGRVFVAGARDTTILNAATGVVMRTIRRGGAALAVDERRGVVFLLGRSGLVALDARDGAVLRAVTLPQDAVRANALAADPQAGRILVGVDVGTGVSGIATYDEVTGRLVHQIDQAGGSPIAVDSATGRVFVVNNQVGHTAGGSVIIFMVDVHSGRLVNTINADTYDGLGVAVTEVVALSAGRLLVASYSPPAAPGPGGPPTTSIAILDARSGYVLGHVAAGAGSPAAAPSLVIDEQTKRVFVANPDDKTISVFDLARL